MLLFSCKVQHHFATLERGEKLGRVNVAKTSGTVGRDGRKSSLSLICTSLVANNTRNNCGMHFSSSSLLVSKVEWRMGCTYSVSAVTIKIPILLFFVLFRKSIVLREFLLSKLYLLTIDLFWICFFRYSRLIFI